MSSIKQRQVVAGKAVILRGDKFLLIRESNSYKDGTNEGAYDFPGGRIKFGESIEDGLKREVKEEVGLSVDLIKPIYIDHWMPVIKGTQLQIVGIFFLCSTNEFNVSLSSDHDDYRWMNKGEIENIKVLDPNPYIIKNLL